MQNKLKIQDVFINNQNESMVQSSRAACEAKQLLMKEKLETESLRALSESLKADLQQAKASTIPLQTMISGLQIALQESERKAQTQELENQRLEVLNKELNSKLAEETRVIESLQEKNKVLDVCSASLATLKQELEQKCSKVESLEAALVQALKKREAELKNTPQKADPTPESTKVIVEEPAAPTNKVVSNSTPQPSTELIEQATSSLEKQIKELKDEFNTKENDLYQRIKELQSKLQDEKTRAEHFKFDFEETKEKLLTANVTIAEYRNSKSALQSQLNDVVTERNMTNKIVVEKDTLIFQLKMNFAILADLLRKHNIRKNPDSEEPERLSDGDIVDVIEKYIEQTKAQSSADQPPAGNHIEVEATAAEGGESADQQTEDLDGKVSELRSQIEELENQLKQNAEQSANDITMLKNQKKDLFEKLKNTETERDKLRTDSTNFKSQLVERDHTMIQLHMQIQDYKKSADSLVALLRGENAATLAKGSVVLTQLLLVTSLQKPPLCQWFRRSSQLLTNSIKTLKL